MTGNPLLEHAAPQISVDLTILGSLNRFPERLM